MKVLSLVVVALLVASCLAIDDKNTKREKEVETSNKRETDTQLTQLEREEMKKFQERLATDPAFKREVEAELEKKVEELPVSERKEAKKRFWGLLGLGLWNPFLFPFFGKRDAATIDAADVKIETVDAVQHQKLTERELKELKKFQERLAADPAFKREVETQLEKKVEELPVSERKEAKKRFWGLLGLGLWNPFLFPFFGKRSVDEQTTTPMMELKDEKRSNSDAAAVKRFWGLWGMGLGFGYPFGFWGKKRMMKSELDDNKDTISAADRELMDRRELEFKRFEEAEKRLAPELYKSESDESKFTVEQVKEMKKRWWGLGYGYGMGLGYGFGLGYPWGFWGKRDAAPIDATEEKKRDSFVDREMKKANREAAYERLFKDL